MDHHDAAEGGKLVVAAHNSSSRHQTQPRSILTEEEYTDTLTHIVTRDYYPALPNLQRDHAILEARSRGDIAAAVAVRRAARKEETKRETEWHANMQEEESTTTVTTALTNYDGGNRQINIRKRPRQLKHETVTGFHARVTSEDNAEFEMNQEREQRELQAKMSVVYSASANKTGRLMIENAINKGADDRVGHGKDDTDIYIRRSLLSDTPGLASDKYNATPSGKRITDGNNDTSPYGDNKQGISKNGLFFEPQHHKQDAVDLKSDNLLMPPPPRRGSNATMSSIIPFQQSNDQPNTSSLSSKPLHKLVEYIPKPTAPDINPPATRFPYQNDSRLLPYNQHRNHSSNMMSIQRSSSDTSASESTDLDASPRSLARERASYQKARIRENETFIPMTPIIRPGGAGVAAEPIMTWGDVASTPLVLGGGGAADGTSQWEPSPLLAIDTSEDEVSAQPAFDVADKSSRESMAMNAEKRLTERSKKYRSGSRKRTEAESNSKPSLATPLDRSASLTPAARALLQASTSNPSSSIFQPSRNGSITNARSKDSFGSALRMSYTPTPGRRLRESKSSKRRKSSSSSMLRQAAGGATPRVSKPR
jgi:protein DGCR14